ncbi:hypothetical protein ABKN59_011444 [Abortiporus biennis]
MSVLHNLTSTFNRTTSTRRSLYHFSSIDNYICNAPESYYIHLHTASLLRCHAELHDRKKSPVPMGE